MNSAKDYSIKSWIRIIPLILLFMLINSCDKVDKPVGPVFEEEAWRDVAEANGMNPDTLSSGFNTANAHQFIYSTLIMRNNTLIAEKYYYRDYTGDNQEEERRHICSCTKSIISALIGIAVNEGFIPSLNQKIMDYFPEYESQIVDQRKFDIKIEHLLYMRGGFGSDDVHPEYWQPVANALLQPLEVNPNSRWYYNSGGCHLLSAILTKATGMSTLDFANQYLFEPLEITPGHWWHDSDGIYGGGLWLHLRPRDLLKFGQLYYNKGKLNDKQIVPSLWVENSVRNQQPVTWEVFPGGQDRTGYGYLWWNGYVNDYWSYHANGYGGQLVFVIPDLDLVIVTTSNPNVPLDDCLYQIQTCIEWIKQYIIGSITHYE